MKSLTEASARLRAAAYLTDLLNKNVYSSVYTNTQKLTLLDWENALARLSGKTLYSSADTLKINICCMRKSVCRLIRSKLGRAAFVAAPKTPQRQGSSLSQLSPFRTPPAPRLSDHHCSEHNQPTTQRSSLLWTQSAHGSAIDTTWTSPAPRLWLCDNRSPPV